MLFPAELRDLVMDSLRDDRAALQACSLTCRAWLPRARHHLFRHIHIDPGPRGIAFKKLIDTNPEIGRHVNDLQISGFVLDKVSSAEVSGNWPTLALPQPNASPRNRGHSSDTTLDHVLPKSIDALSAVSSLRLSALSISKELADLLHKYFSAVKTVILIGCRAGAFRDFCYLPRAFSQTECLHIIDAQWLRTVLPPTAETLPGRPPTLKSLVLSRKVDSTTVVNWLVALRRYTALVSLSCYLTGYPSAIAIRDLLQAVGTALQHLDIGFSDVSDPTSILNNADFSLQPCTGLRTLHVQCSNTLYIHTSPSLSWVLILLSKLESPHIHTLTFSIPALNLRAFNLDGLAVVLLHARYAALRRIVFKVDKCTEPLQHIEQRLDMRLASLHSSGIQIEVYNNVGTKCARLD